MNKRKIALTSGWALIVMAIIAAYSIGFALAEFDPSQAEDLRDRLQSRAGLYTSMLGGLFAIVLLDILVSFTLYEFFKKDNRTLSAISSLLRVIYTVVFAFAISHLLKNADAGLTEASIGENLEAFKNTWYIGLIIFGFHILLIGILMKIHTRIPKILWVTALIAGLSYVFVHLLEIYSPEWPALETLSMILAVPMAVGELGLAIWLVAKGGR